MTDKITEKVSALLDNELPNDQVSGTLRQLQESEELQRQWGSFHMIGDIMRGEAPDLINHNVAGMVRERLIDEPAIIATPGNSTRRAAKQSPRWMRPAAGAAIAASVAVVAVFTFPSLVDQGEDQAGQIAAVPAVPAVATVAAPPTPVTYHERSGTRWKHLSKPGVESKLNSYLVDHSEFASPGGMTGVLPYTTFVGYDSSR